MGRLPSRTRSPRTYSIVLIAVALTAAAVSAHVVYQRKTLREWAQQADVIVVAEILSPLRVWSAADGSDHQEYFSVRIVEEIAGDPKLVELDVFPHAEGEPNYQRGDRAILFLDRTGSRAEFAPLAGRFPYFTTQGAGYEWKLGESDAEIPAIARAWRDAGAAASYQERRDLLLRELRSPNRQLRIEAIGDLAQWKGLTADVSTAAALREMARSDRLTAGERLGLIRVLDGAPGFSAAGETLRLADALQDGGRTSDRIAVIRTAGALRDPTITDWLRRQLTDPDRDIRVAALVALAHPWHAAAVDDVATAVDVTDGRVAAEAVRTLGGIGSEQAIDHLRDLAANRAPPTSNLARAELKRLERGR